MEYNKKSGRHGNVHRFFRDRNPEHSMPATSNLTQPSIVHRGVRLRLLPGTPAVRGPPAGRHSRSLPLCLEPLFGSETAAIQGLSLLAGLQDWT